MSESNQERAANLGDMAEMHNAVASCPHCAADCEFELPAPTGSYEIACHHCAETYQIDAQSAIEAAAALDEAPEDEAPEDEAPEDEALEDNTPEFEAALEEDIAEDVTLAGDDEAALEEDEGDSNTVTCLDCGEQIELPEIADDEEMALPDCPHCAQNKPAKARRPLPPRETRSSRAGIWIVSIISIALVASAGMITLGLYFLSISKDSDTARYIETNILQVKPASFSVDSAAYEISETDLGKSLLVTINVTNTGGQEGTPNAMQVVLTDQLGKALVSWPLDVSGQIITAGQTVQLYTRLFEPPESFTNLKVYLR